MAPLPTESTARYWIDYTTSYGSHSMQFRVGTGATDEGFQLFAQGLLDLLTPVLTVGWAVTGVRRASDNSTISLPATVSLSADVSTTPLLETDAPRFVSWVGRGPAGRRVRLYLYGSTIGIDKNYRKTFNELPLIQAVVNHFNDNPTYVRTIAEDVPIWNRYANLGYNAYFQRKRRVVGTNPG